MIIPEPQIWTTVIKIKVTHPMIGLQERHNSFVSFLLLNGVAVLTDSWMVYGSQGPNFATIYPASKIRSSIVCDTRKNARVKTVCKDAMTSFDFETLFLIRALEGQRTAFVGGSKPSTTLNAYQPEVWEKCWSALEVCPRGCKQHPMLPRRFVQVNRLSTQQNRKSIISNH